MEGFADPGIEKLALDVTNDQNVLDVVKTVIEKEGRIDIVVNNAGANCAGEFQCRLFLLTVINLTFT